MPTLLIASCVLFSSAQNISNVLSLLPIAFEGLQEVVSLLPVQCNGTTFVSLETGFAAATANQTWQLIGNFNNLTWAGGLNVTSDTPALLNQTETGATRSYNFLGANVTDTLLFSGGLAGTAYATVFEQSGAGSPSQTYTVNGANFDKVLTTLIVLNNSLSIGSHLVWLGVGCTSGNASAAQSTYAANSLAGLGDIVRIFAS